MLAEALLKNRVLEAVCEKNCKPRASPADGQGDRGGWGVLGASGVPDLGSVMSDLLVSWKTAVAVQGADDCTHACTFSEKHPRYGYRHVTALLRQKGWRVGKRQLQRLRRAEGLRVPSTKRKDRAPWSLDRTTDQGDPPGTCLDMGLHQ